MLWSWNGKQITLEVKCSGDEWKVINALRWNGKIIIQLKFNRKIFVGPASSTKK